MYQDTGPSEQAELSQLYSQVPVTVEVLVRLYEVVCVPFHKGKPSSGCCTVRVAAVTCRMVPDVVVNTVSKLIVEPR
jgi:hypothetical protein